MMVSSTFLHPKKHLGQHFLRDENIARKIVGALTGENYDEVLEVGPGTGVLTKYLSDNNLFSFHAIEVDKEAAAYLSNMLPGIKDRLIIDSFLHFDPASITSSPLAVIGNLPYNISSQILFKILAHRHQVVETVCMLQKEVADRILSPPGKKTYGILSVLIQAFYDTEKLFDVSSGCFFPPPAVRSTVIRLTRNQTKKLACDESVFFRVVKTAFNQRRKMLSNALRPLGENIQHIPPEYMKRRAEELHTEDFVEITQIIQ